MAKTLLTFLFIFLFVPVPVNANLRLASVFGDHMVLQHGRPAPVWGWTEALQKVVVEMAGEAVSTIADSTGKWMAELTQQKAGGPYTLLVTAKETITIEDVYVGEVWLCSGQSNMDMTVAREDRYWCGVYNEEEEVANANYPLIRFFDVEFNTRDEPQETVQGKWEVCSPQTIGHLSATAYFFGRELFKKYNVPIGLITSAYGASTAEAWTSRPYLEAHKDFQFLLDNYAEKCSSYDTNETVKIQFIEASERWAADAAIAKTEGKDPPRKPKDPDPHNDQHNPCVLFNGMIAPLVPYAIKGVIWYQGESNYPTAHIYDGLMETLIYNWRDDWKQGDFPFIYVQLANHQKRVEEPVKDDPMVLVREKQLKNLSIRNTAMVVAIDNANPENPDDIHPKNKQEIGKRLAIAAMGKVYHEKITYMGPVFNHMVIDGDKVILYFNHVGEGFMIKGEEIKGFAIAGEDKQFVWGHAEIDGDKIIVTGEDIKNPVYIRYGWSKNPEVNLYNKTGLPLSPFRTDDW